MSRLVFLDTETVGLADECDIWEIGLIARTDAGDVEYCWRLRPDMVRAEPTGLRIGRYYERIGKLAYKPVGSAVRVVNPRGGGDDEAAGVAFDLAQLLDGATIVGAVPDFDARHLSRWLAQYDQCGTWHYHLHCVETLALGYLAGQNRLLPPLPVRSDDLSRMVGVEPPGDTERHTALGDARWVRDIWDAITGGRTAL